MPTRRHFIATCIGGLALAQYSASANTLKLFHGVQVHAGSLTIPPGGSLSFSLHISAGIMPQYVKQGVTASSPQFPSHRAIYHGGDVPGTWSMRGEYTPPGGTKDARSVIIPRDGTCELVFYRGTTVLYKLRIESTTPTSGTERDIFTVRLS